MARIIAVINQKGGVGKTTCVTNLGAALAQLDQKVLLIDMDPQANLSLHLGYTPGNIEYSVYNVLKGQKRVTEALIDRGERLLLLPATLDLSGAEIELVNEVGRESLLKRALDPIKADYDFILIDCPPSLGLLTLNALTASRELFIPIQTEFLALYGMSKLIEMVGIIRQRINSELALTGIIRMMVDRRKKLTKEIEDNIASHFHKLVFHSYIRENVSLAEAPGHQQTIFEYASRSNGALDFINLAKEVLAMPS